MAKLPGGAEPPLGQDRQNPKASTRIIGGEHIFAGRVNAQMGRACALRVCIVELRQPPARSVDGECAERPSSRSSCAQRRNPSRSAWVGEYSSLCAGHAISGRYLSTLDVQSMDFSSRKYSLWGTRGPLRIFPVSRFLQVWSPVNSRNTWRTPPVPKVTSASAAGLPDDVDIATVFE
jgi:hypothetical protein